jgi:tRNA 2-selenouridine synthase
MRVWHALKQLDPTRPVFVESESKKVGNVAVPESLIAAMRLGSCLNLLLSDQERVALLMEEYDFFVQNTDAFCERLGALTELRGHEVVKGWVAQVNSGHIADVVQELLTHHYDPVYIQSMKRNFAQYAQAADVRPVDRTPEAMLTEAKKLVAELATPASI